MSDQVGNQNVAFLTSRLIWLKMKWGHSGDLNISRHSSPNFLIFLLTDLSRGFCLFVVVVLLVGGGGVPRQYNNDNDMQNNEKNISLREMMMQCSDLHYGRYRQTIRLSVPRMFSNFRRRMSSSEL